MLLHDYIHEDRKRQHTDEKSGNKYPVQENIIFEWIL